MKIEVIDTGYFWGDGGAMFGTIPKSSWQRRYPSNETNSCALAMRSLLITTDDNHIILVDNGAGNKHLQTLGYYRFFDLVDLYDALHERGLQPSQITDVVLTHLHFDHCGYSTIRSPHHEALMPAFPNASYWVSRSQWNNFLAPNPLELDSYFKENMDVVEKANLLRFIDSDFNLSPNIRFRLFDGHTSGQIVVDIDTTERTYVFAGDVIPLMANLTPSWISAYDTFPVTSYHEKVRLLEEAVQKEQAIIYCHDAYTRCSTVKKIGKSFRKNEIIDL